MNPRIAPIERPKGLIQFIVFWYFKNRFGKVIMPAKVIYHRYPEILIVVKKMYGAAGAFTKLSDSLRLSIQCFVAQINGCTFCMDLSKKEMLNRKVATSSIRNPQHSLDINEFIDRERAILNYAAEVSKTIVVMDETFMELKKYCSDEEIIEITYIVAMENFLNRMTRSLNIESDDLCSIN